MKLRITAIALAIAAALLAGCAPAGTQTQDTTATPAPTQTQAPAKEASVKAGENYRILIWETTMRTIGCLTTEAAVQAK